MSGTIESQPSQWGTVTLAMYEKLELDTAAPAPQAQDWKKEPEYVPPLVK